MKALKTIFLLGMYSTLSGNEFQIEEDDTDIIYYSEDIERSMNYSTMLEAKEVVKQLDILIEKMHSFQEKQYINDFKQKFSNKYFYENTPIENINRNINKILNERTNKKLIQYEREINEEQQLLK
jgi:hypothetical protein